MLTPPQQKLKDSILATPPENPVCLHVLGQPLVNDMCAVIREMQEQVDMGSKFLRTEVSRYQELQCEFEEYKLKWPDVLGGNEQ